MLSLTVLITVIAASTVSIKEAHSKPAQGIDIENFLQSLQQQLQQEQLQQQRKEDQLQLQPDPQNRQDDDDDDDEESYGTLRNGEIEQLLRLATNQRDNSDRDWKVRQYSDNNDDDARSYDRDEQLLEELNLLQNVQDRSKKRQNKGRVRVQKQRLQPNSLLGGPLGLPYEDRSNRVLQSVNNDDSLNDPNEYSDVYLILNPDALQKSKNRDRINDLLSNLISSSYPRTKGRRERRKDRLYKGFVVKDDNPLTMRRRLNRDSKEIFAKGNSMEKDYKPKRSRGERGGGGGGGSGRTAIPYIRHHGDIYERDN